LDIKLSGENWAQQAGKGSMAFIGQITGIEIKSDLYQETIGSVFGQTNCSITIKSIISCVTCSRTLLVFLFCNKDDEKFVTGKIILFMNRSDQYSFKVLPKRKLSKLVGQSKTEIIRQRMKCQNLVVRCFEALQRFFPSLAAKSWRKFGVMVDEVILFVEN
jgi:hypothetical protein